jgi:hypothetical protein
MQVPVFTVDEPLAKSAPYARKLARGSCADAAVNRTCEPYHAFWQYMRLMGLGKTLSGQSARYLSTLEQFARESAGRRAASPARVLISGCADYSLLAHVLHACGSANQRVEVTAIDVCPTPLLLNQWYARRLGHSLTVACSDILQHHSADAYDMIVTSGFLGYFRPEVRVRMFKGYASMLREGGRLIIANRLRDGTEGEAVGFSSQQIDLFAARAAQLSAVLPASARLEPDDALRMARAYAEEFKSYPVNSEESVKRLAIASGLQWAEGGCVPSVRLQAGVNGPTMGDGSDYLFAILGK